MQQLKIWIVGSVKWSMILNAEIIEKAREVWKWIAKNRCVLVAGSCNGLPNEATIWAKNAWWFVLWLSPAFSRKEHLEVYRSPLDSYDITLFTWKWIKEKSLTNVRSVDAVIVIWWWTWSLNEFTIAYDEWKIIWILEWTWWISDHIPEILNICNRDLTENIIFSKDPRELVEKIVLWINEIYTPVIEDERVLTWKGN